MNKTNEENREPDNANGIVNVPMLNIRMMTDDEWNRLAYRMWLEERGVLV